MIKSIKIKDVNNTRFRYINELQEFPKEIHFKPGINIIVGPNGSGKTTIFDIIRYYRGMTDLEYTSPTSLSKFKDIWKRTNKFSDILETNLEGIVVEDDYNRPIFNLPTGVYTDLRECDSFNDFGDSYLATYSSSGEVKSILHNRLLEAMFGSKITETYYNELVNDETVDHILDSYKDYISKYHQPSDIFTILMDEPDTNLDIDRMSQIFGILTTDRPDTQLIAIIHNPFLIYKLIDFDNINFIELEEGYIQKVCGTVDLIK